MAPDSWESLLDTESEDGSVAGRAAGGGPASDFSDRFSFRVLRTMIMSFWHRSSCWEQREMMLIKLFHNSQYKPLHNRGIKNQKNQTGKIYEYIYLHSWALDGPQ